MLFAVHISDGILAAPWWLGGFVLAAVLLWIAAYRLRDEEVPRIALLTAAVFIASSIHVRLGPSSVHLLLNGLAGVLLGWRVSLAIAVGLLLQAVLIGHGGYYALGVNTCVLTLPALACGLLFRRLHGLPATKRPLGRWVLAGMSGLLWYLTVVYSVFLLMHRLGFFQDGDAALLGEETYKHILIATLNPRVVLGGVLLALGGAWLEKRLENAPEFPLGLLLGVVSVLLTVALNYAVLILGAGEVADVSVLVVLVLAHLPVALIEGIVLGFAVGFLARVKPELLGDVQLHGLAPVRRTGVERPLPDVHPPSIV
jgi:cobalt/nickel transport system permease protein